MLSKVCKINEYTGVKNWNDKNKLRKSSWTCEPTKSFMRP